MKNFFKISILCTLLCTLAFNNGYSSSNNQNNIKPIQKNIGNSQNKSKHDQKEREYIEKLNEIYGIYFSKNKNIPKNLSKHHINMLMKIYRDKEGIQLLKRKKYDKILKFLQNIELQELKSEEKLNNTILYKSNFEEFEKEKEEENKDPKQEYIFNKRDGIKLSGREQKPENKNNINISNNETKPDDTEELDNKLINNKNLTEDLQYIKMYNDVLRKENNIENTSESSFNEEKPTMEESSDNNLTIQNKKKTNENLFEKLLPNPEYDITNYEYE